VTPVSDDHAAGPDLGSQHLVTHVANRVLHVRIDRVEYRNAFTQDMYRGIKRAAVWADAQPELDAVCLTGTDEWFGAGGDLAGRKEDPEGLAAEWDGTDHFPFRHIERCRKIWVAKINGACHAGGLGIALHCDVSIASDRATFRVPELLRGIPDPFMSARLVDAVGLAKARYLFFTAARFDAAEAASMGIVGEVVAHDDLDARTDWILEQVRSTGPIARAAIKRDINSQLRPADLTLFQGLGLRAELVEGMGAFVEKRPVDWPRPAD